ncbi:hypothetical protein SOP93_17315 [Peribacillus frigoritolerans]|uniref:hypothetical protein n=1 Tax=Peribacillus frigoritolerans TaxID=450367 RepID=UPI002B24AF98|nr:hypothetical protein [Peribacillus frigoritolerans]MEB2492924.1 hypothetical protein [Peribacillus frigoritolerans]
MHLIMSLKWFRDVFLGGSLFAWVWYIVIGIYNGTLNLKPILSSLFLNEFSFAFLIIALIFLAIELTPCLLKAYRCWRDDREERLAKKIADKIK